MHPHSHTCERIKRINQITNTSFSQAPFYPHEAEKKGCVPSEYGLVFGIFELTVFLVSPLIGANLNRMGLKVTKNEQVLLLLMI